MPNFTPRGRIGCPLCEAPLGVGRAVSDAIFECPFGHVYGTRELLRQLSRTAARHLRRLLESLESSLQTSVEIVAGAEEMGENHLARDLRRQAEDSRRLAQRAGTWFREEARSQAR